MAQFNCVDRISLFLFLISILPIVYSSNDTSSTSVPFSVTPFSTANITKTVHINSTAPLTTFPVSMTSTHMPASPTSPSTPARTSSGSILPTPTVLPTSSFINFTTVKPTTVEPTLHPTDCHTCEQQLAAEKRYKWTAVTFDIIFAIALAVMTIMYLRQRKMYREMEGDGSLSRLI